MGNPAGVRRDFAALERAADGGGAITARRDSASPRWRASWACTGSRSAAGRGSLRNPACAGYARPAAPVARRSSALSSCVTSSARSSAGPRRSDMTTGLVDRRPGARSHRVPHRGALPRGPRLAHPAQAGLDLPAADRAGAGARRGRRSGTGRSMAWPRIKKKRSASGAPSSSSTRAD